MIQRKKKEAFFKTYILTTFVFIGITAYISLTQDCLFCRVLMISETVNEIFECRIFGFKKKIEKKVGKLKGSKLRKISKGKEKYVQSPEFFEFWIFYLCRVICISTNDNNIFLLSDN